MNGILFVEVVREMLATGRRQRNDVSVWSLQARGLMLPAETRPRGRELTMAGQHTSAQTVGCGAQLVARLARLFQ